MNNIKPKTHLTISNIIMYIGAAFAAIDIIYDLYTGANNENLPIAIILAVIFFIAGIVYRFTMVKCPHCGDRLMGKKDLPDKCPNCGLDINKTAEEIAAEAEEEEQDEAEEAEDQQEENA